MASTEFLDYTIPPSRVPIATGAAPASGGQLVGLWALLALHRRLSIAVVVAGCALFGAPAWGQSMAEDTSFPIERFRLSTGTNGLLDVEWAEVSRHLAWDLGMWVSASDDPLELYEVDDGEWRTIGQLVSHRVAATLVGSIGLWDRVQVGVELPLVLSQGQDVPDAFMNPELSSIGLGDIRLIPKIGLWSGKGFHFAVIPSVTLPTGGADYMGESGVTFAPEVVASKGQGAWRTSLNLGYRARPGLQVADLNIDDEIFARLGAAYRLDHGDKGPPVELALTLSTATSAASPLDSANSNHAEVNGGASYRITDSLIAVASAGVGLRPGFGTPDWRAVAAIRFSSRGADKDSDGDGIRDEDDQCPLVAEDRDSFEDSDGCPDLDNDRDGVPDTDDGAPNEPEDRDGHADDDGVPDPDNDGDGVLDDDDKCPMVAETKNGFQDSDGCPDEIPDTDDDGIADNLDKCPDQAEDMDSFEDSDGCPDIDNDGDGVLDTDDSCRDTAGVAGNQGCPDTDRDGDTVVDRLDNCPDEPGSVDNRGCRKKQTVALGDGAITLLGKVYFATNKAVIRRRSHAMLRQVADVLKAHPEYRLVQVEGHTDDRGDDDFNLNLSQQRADAVVAFLVAEGVAADRLVGKGFGETVPVESNDTRSGRGKNRRVEFKIVEQASPR